MLWFEELKKESKYTPENLSEEKRRLFESEPSFDVDFPDYEHPENEKELPKVLAMMNANKIDDDEMGDLDQNNNEMMLKIVGESKEDREDLIEDIDIHTIKLKVKYGRPRPYEISDKIESTTDTDDSPSFPSGHAMEAYALAKILGKEYPDKQEELDKMAAKISLSRVQMGNHYPSDIEVGKKAGTLIGETYLDRNMKKSWQDIVKKDKKDMRVGTVYPSDREGKKIMMLTHEGKKIHAGAKGYGNYKRKGKNRGGGTHKDPARRKNFRARHNCDQCKGRITSPKCLACKKLW